MGTPSVSPSMMAKPKPYERPYDKIDADTRGGAIDTHADIPLPNKPLNGKEPGIGSMLFEGGVDVVSVFVPALRNFNDQVNRATMDHDGKGLQVFSSVEMGLPVVPTLSLDLYADLMAWPSGSHKNPLIAWVWQVMFTYREIEANSDRLTPGWDFKSALHGIQQGRTVAQLGIEGAFPFADLKHDIPQLLEFLKKNEKLMPKSFPRPTLLELSQMDSEKPYLGLLTYARRVGEQYMGLSHLVGDCFAGGGPWPAKDLPLSDEGKELVREMDEVGMMVDVAHASPSSQAGLVAMKKAGEIKLPTIASHTLFKTPYNDPPAWRVTEEATLDQLDYVGVIAARAHLEGYNFFDVLDWLLVWPFRLVGLNWHFPGWTDPMVFIDDMIDQLDYVRERRGIDVCGLGLDGCGFVGLPYKNYAEVHDALRKRMAERGPPRHPGQAPLHKYTQEEIDKVFGGNWLHVLKRRDEILAARENAPCPPPQALPPAPKTNAGASLNQRDSGALSK